MGWFNGLLKLQAPALSHIPDGLSPRVSGDRSGVRDQGLISELKVDHREMQIGMVELREAVDHAQYSAVPHHLRALKTRLEAHLLTENYRLYARLEEQMSDAPDNAGLMRDLRREMGSLSRETLQFIDEWQQRGVDAGSADLFEERLRHISTLLNQRIDREEQSLFPIYEALERRRGRPRRFSA
ncbi:MAG TPA: hemerythrin domain-containing protein [Gammaproteobacteria bacterium]|nr:hemerythrin domain-containing protein [Gammaproteobacteria bacterium]